MSPQVALELYNLSRYKYSPGVGVGVVLPVVVVLPVGGIGLAGVFCLCNITQV